MAKGLFYRKSVSAILVQAQETEHTLRRSLTATNLVLLGLNRAGRSTIRRTRNCHLIYIVWSSVLIRRTLLLRIGGHDSNRR
jgi:hypothetical protein